MYSMLCFILAAVEFVVYIMWGSFMGYLWFIFDDASKVNNTHALLLFSMSLNDMGERDAKYLLGCRELYIIF